MRKTLRNAHFFYVTYLITFSCYGTHLHGDPRGSVDRGNNQPGAPLRPPNRSLETFEREEMAGEPYSMDESRRQIAMQAIRQVCEYRRWSLIAVHVRTNHVHTIVDLDAPPQSAAHDFKSYASRALNRAGLDLPGRKRWARHFSVRSIPDREACARALAYVINQGEPMALWVADERAP